MAKVDNFDIIAENFLFSEDLREEIAKDRFYTLQIMTRSKDTGEKTRTIHTMFIESREYLLSHKDIIVKLCETFNARAYISVNPSSYKTCAIKAVGELGDLLDNGNYRGIVSLPATLAGKYTVSDENKKWIVDLDGVECGDDCKPYIEFIRGEYSEGKGKPNWSIMVLPTVNGSHLLVTPFDTREFKKKWPEIDILRNNPALLYYGG